MASRKPRYRRDIRRVPPERQPYDRVLIVCEDKKAAPKYFEELRDRYRLSNANIVVEGTGADPRRIIQLAKRWRNEEKRRNAPYDEIFCVFDRDQHTHFNMASSDAQAADLRLARSWPCFEFWLLLHFIYQRRPYGPSGNRTASQNCVRELRTHLCNYTKGMAGVFRVLEARLDTAKNHAGRAQTDAKATGRADPSTEVHRLVAYLQALKRT